MNQDDRLVAYFEQRKPGWTESQDPAYWQVPELTPKQRRRFRKKWARHYAESARAAEAAAQQSGQP